MCVSRDPVETRTDKQCDLHCSCRSCILLAAMVTCGCTHDCGRCTSGFHICIACTGSFVDQVFCETKSGGVHFGP